MTDNLNYAWRAIPLDQIIPYSRLLEELELAGYLTAGDVLSVEPSDLAADVYGVGPIRAIKIRQKIFDYVRPQLLSDMNDWRMVDPKHEIEETTPSAADAIATLCSIVAVGLIVYLLAWWVL